MQTYVHEFIIVIHYLCLLEVKGDGPNRRVNAAQQLNEQHLPIGSKIVIFCFVYA